MNEKTTIKQIMLHHPLFFFFFMSYAFSWIVLIPYILSVWGYLPDNVIFRLVAPTIGTYGPALAAIIMVSIIEGRTGRNDLRKRIRQRRTGWQWYLFIIAGIPALILMGIIIQPGALASFQGLTPLLLVNYPLYFFAVIFGGGPLGEEIGWRGFALPRMQPRYGPLQGTLILGVLWSFWHLPRFLAPEKGGGPGVSLTTLLANFTMFFLFVMAIAIIFTWIFNHTGGSIFTAILAHASVNTPELVFVPLFLAIDYTSMNLAYIIGFGAPAVFILIMTRGRLGYQTNIE